MKEQTAYQAGYEAGHRCGHFSAGEEFKLDPAMDEWEAGFNAGFRQARLEKAVWNHRSAKEPDELAEQRAERARIRRLNRWLEGRRWAR